MKISSVALNYNATATEQTLKVGTSRSNYMLLLLFINIFIFVALYKIFTLS